MLQLSLNPESSLPLVEQIVGGVRNQIEDRLLRPGMRLPPIRAFAAEHSVSRFTVVEAYDRLVALGFLESRRGSGFYVAVRHKTPMDGVVTGEIERAFENLSLAHQSLDDSGDLLKVGVGWLPTEWMDEEGVLRNIRTLARRNDSRVTNYGAPQGYLPLREQISRKLLDFGIGVHSKQIVLTHGATQGLDLIVRGLLKPGDCVLVDDPGYWNLFANLRLQGVNLVGVPRTIQGPDCEQLELLLAEHRPKAFFTQSVLQNPTSCNISPANAFRLLQLAEKHDFLIVEDDVNSDLFAGQATRLAQLDQLKRVIYVGSFSKTLSSNLRVGFIACAPEFVSVFNDIMVVSCFANSEFAERLTYLMLTEGHYRKFIDRMHVRLAEATDIILRMLERYGLKVYAEPKGGMFVWAAAPGLMDSAALASRAAKAGVMLAPGNIFRPQMQSTPYLRFNIAYALDPRFEQFLGGNIWQTGTSQAVLGVRT